MNNFIFIQYTGGSCGKAIGVCLQTAQSVLSWSLPDIDTLVEMHTNDYKHIREEPDAPYKFPWMTRTPGVTRGDDLKRHDVLKLLEEDNLINEDKLIVTWTKPYLPAWYNDTVIQIVVDEQSLPWLIERRKKVFYIESAQGTIEVRHDKRYATKPEYCEHCVSELNIDDLAFLQTHEELIPVNDQAHHVQLKDIINKNWNPVFNTLEQAANSVIDRQWCKEYLDAWHNQII
jgi:hypothetical protein|tara:strand:+ start:674 stop:1366 length:693 start_codon:yes stop_codon:yes gene_type:complete